MSRTTKKIRNPARKPKHLPVTLVKQSLPENNQHAERLQRQERRAIKIAGRRVMRRRLKRIEDE